MPTKAPSTRMFFLLAVVVTASYALSNTLMLAPAWADDHKDQAQKTAKGANANKANAKKKGIINAQAAPRVANLQPEGDEDDAYADILFPTDRTTVRQLSMARVLLDDQRYSEAVRHLGHILDADQDYFFQPDPRQPFHRSLKAEAMKLIGELPPEGREAYRLQYGARARRMLTEGVQTGNPEIVAEVSRKYFHTPAGYEATLLLAADHLDHSRALAAALCLERLRSTDQVAAKWEPMLSLQLATCWLRAGLVEKSAETLLRLRERTGGKPISIGGESIEWFTDDDDAVKWFSERLGPQLQAAVGDLAEWLMFRGNASRTAMSPGGSPLLNPRWRVPTTDDPTIEKIIVELQDRLADQHRTSLPSVHPLVVDEVVLMRTTSNLLAVDLVTGKRLWNVPADDSIEALLDVRGGAAANSPQLETGLQKRIWNDATYGTLSSDGRFVFSIEDLNPFSGLISVTRGQPMLANQQAMRAYNRLAAHDIRTGKLVWELGGPSGEAALKLADTYFLGPPLPMAGQLYCLAEAAGEIQLLVLSARTGELEWSQQLAMLERNILQDPLRASCGASPSYADGVMVCPTSAGAVIAVNLTTRSLLWGYRYPVTETYENNTRMMFVRRGGAVFQAGAQSANVDGWSDSSVTITEGRVILTPAESDEMFCLDLLDGSLIWKGDRQDGLYVASIHDKDVIVVGHGGLRALSLENGESAWEHAAEFPDSAVPSGRGFINGKHLFVPLSTAEVATFDLNDGKLVARSRSRDGSVPGNLICHGGSVLAQGVQNLESFFQLEHLEDQVKQTLSENPQDAAALALRGEIRLHGGAVDEAVDDLRRSFELVQDPHTQQLLVDALLEGLRIDFATYRATIDELESLIEQPERRGRYLRLLATGLHSTGEVEEAFQAYLRFTDPSLGRLKLEPIDGVLSVRRDRWVRTRIGELWEMANDDQRQAMNDELADRLSLAMRSDGIAGLREFLAYFGNQALAERARAELVDRLLERGDNLAAEFELRRLQNSSTAEVSHLATARLALLLASSRRPEDAAPYYRRLNGPLAEIVCLNGKTGSELFAEVPDASPVRNLLQGQSPWPAGQVEKTREVKNVNPIRYFGFEIQGPKGPFFDDVHIEIDQSRRTLVGRDGLGRIAWHVNVIEPGTNNGPNFNQHVNHGRVAGHLLMLTLGHELLAIDVLHASDKGGSDDGARILWRRSLAESILGGQGNAVPQFRQFQAAWGNRIVINANGWQPSGTLATLSDGLVCFEENRKLVVADPLTGETLWVRRDVPSGSFVWGDDEVLLVAPPEETEAIVLRASDGEELGKCTVAPMEQRVCTLGRRVVVWKTSRDGSVVRMVDPYAGSEAWSHTFAAKSRARLINNEELAIVDPSGRFVLLSLSDGVIKIDTPIEKEKKLNEVFALRSRDYYIIVANRPWQQAPNVFINPLPGGFGCVVVNGMVYGFDRHTGEKLWSQEVRNQGLVLTQPCEMPVLAFASQIHRQQINNRGGRRYETAVVCLDKRNGHVLHQERQANTVSAVSLTANPASASVALNMQRAKVVMTFTDKAFDPDDAPPREVINGAADGEDEKPREEPAADKEKEPGAE